MKCEYCESTHSGEYGSGRFCNKKCACGFSTSKNRECVNRKISKALGGKHYVYIPKEKHCLYCGEKLNKTAKKFCNLKCTHEYRYLIYINKWKLGFESGRRGKLETSKYIRKYMLRKHKHKCQKCRWSKINPVSKTVPLDLHHIDGNFKNNVEENLEIICPNCHSITTTYKSLNKNNERIYIQDRHK